MGLFRSLREAGLDGEDVATGVRRGLRPLHSHGDIVSEDTPDSLTVGRFGQQRVLIAAGTGVIVAAGDKGEDDFDDARYWVKTTIPLATTNKKSVWAMGSGAAQNRGTLIALNLAELDADAPTSQATPATGTHELAVGTPVVLFVAPDDQGIDRYFFCRPLTTITKFGKVKAWTGGSNTVTLTPCAEDGTVADPAPDDVDVNVTLPTTRTVCSFVFVEVDDVLVYFEKGDTRWLASVPMPYSTTRYDVYQVTAASGQGGFDSVRVK